MATILLSLCIESKAQFTFSVNPGIQLNSAGFGYKINKFVPFIGLQVFSISSELNESGKRYDDNIGDIISYEDKYKYSGTLFMPVLGLKCFFIEKNKLKAYGTACFTKPFLTGKIENNTNAPASDEVNDMVKNANLWGGQFGFGTEYFFDDNFSIGGEFGIRLLHLKYKYEVDEIVYNPDTGEDVPSTTTYEYKFNLNPTYAKLSLNFYFSK